MAQRHLTGALSNQPILAVNSDTHMKEAVQSIKPQLTGNFSYEEEGLVHHVMN